jgi:hypothetical protein
VAAGAGEAGGRKIGAGQGEVTREANRNAAYSAGFLLTRNGWPPPTQHPIPHRPPHDTRVSLRVRQAVG